MKDFAEMKRGFGRTDRFLYEKQAFKMASCGPNLGPASHDPIESFKKLNKFPCATLMVS